MVIVSLLVYTSTPAAFDSVFIPILNSRVVDPVILVRSGSCCSLRSDPDKDPLSQEVRIRILTILNRIRNSAEQEAKESHVFIFRNLVYVNIY